MAVSISELSSVNYGALIGGPMNAIIQSQFLAAQNAINLIAQNAFDPSTGDPKYIEFNYERINPDYDPNATDPTDPTEVHTLKIPYLLMLPNTFLSVGSADIEFNAKIHGITYDKTTTDTKWGVDLKASAGWGWGRASLNASFSHQKKRAFGSEEQRTYSMNVKVHMVPSENEALGRVFDILESNITSRPKSS